MSARDVVRRLFGRIHTGSLTVVEGSQRWTFGTGEPAAVVQIHDERVWRAVLLKGSRGMAETYADGLWDSPELVDVIRVAALNVGGIDALRRKASLVREPFQRARAAIDRNTPERNRRDIAAHYDLGNELFGLMLDPTLMYSGAFFAEDDMTLHEASVAKLDLICDKLDLGPDDHLLEIGTGWGGLAVHAAERTGCRVTTTTISREQHSLAVDRVQSAGLEDRVTVLLEDYRDLRGTYSKLVSVEMIEAVGWQDFGTFFAKCSSLLEPDGLMLLQAITMDDRAYMVERASKSFIRTLVFPNGCLPSQEVIARCIARETDLRTVQLEDLSEHYARTLRHWRENLEAAAGELEEHGYDERFRRLWRMYLCYCEAGFAERRIGLIQSVLAKPARRAAVPASMHGRVIARQRGDVELA